ncbi:hypothetical protein J437_LFUL016456 [Ladona fulva]|uniref:FYVE, RhoGEF and PH domain-containing protein 6 n=1 Tax=Ladona fulva TaxID=123851 RepID=A0A8K0KLT0_LADFU|nr:hypothetical protein J437_LFUL016456 [Ladona fulva]
MGYSRSLSSKYDDSITLFLVIKVEAPPFRFGIAVARYRHVLYVGLDVKSRRTFHIVSKMKPLPPPKPISPQNPKIFKHPLNVPSTRGILAESQGSSDAGSFAFRGSTANDSNSIIGEVRSGNLDDHIKLSSKSSPSSREIKSDKHLVNHDSSPQLVGSQLQGKSKPPLLPKPGVTCLSLQNSKPPVPKRPSFNQLAKKNVQESSTQTQNAAKRLTVASRVQEFENSEISNRNISSLHNFASLNSRDGENPIRPPRSPKHKPFAGTPFEFLSKQAVSPRQKNFSLPQNVRHIFANWENKSEVSHEELAGNQRLAKEKSCSLGRSISLSSHESSAVRSNNFGDNPKLPKPPPRRVKKKSDLSTNLSPPCENVNIPVYAVVNYELKKNRRSQVLTDSEAKNSLSEHGCSETELAAAFSLAKISQLKTEVNSVVDTQVNATETKVEDSDKNQCTVAEESVDVICGNLYLGKDLDSESQKESKDERPKDFTATSYIMEEKASCDSSLEVCNYLSECCDEDEALFRHAASCLASLLHNNKEEEDKLLDHNRPSEGKDEVISEGLCSEVVSEVCCSFAEVRGNTNRNCDHCESKDEIPAYDKELDNFQPCQIGDKVDKLTNLDLSESSQIEGENKSTKEGHCSCESIESNGQLRDFFSSKMTCGSYCSLNALEKVRSSNEDDVEFKRNQSASPPLRSKLNPLLCRGIDPSRRQSWCDGEKNESLSSVNSSGGKQSKKIKKSSSLWCDEEDVSAGHLGDQSSFEDVTMAATGDMSPVCRRFSAIFSSFGKSSKKSQKQEERAGKVISRFYCSTHEEKLDSKQETVGDIKEVCVDSELLKDKHENQLGEGSDKCQLMEDVSSLRVKECTVDLKRKSDEFGSEHLSEGSYENAPSESDNEEQLEDKLDSCLSSSQRREKKAFYIARELMTSERAFVDVLKLLCLDFQNAVIKARIEEKHQIISDEDLGKILNNLPHLLTFNEDLLRDLEDRISNWSSNPKIADIIVRKGPFLKLYTSYFINFETQCQLLDVNCENNPRFAKVLRDFEVSPRCQKLAVKHYMLKPIQRVPQYRLLLEDYLAHLEPTSDDYSDTQIALKIVCDVADHANRSMKQGLNDCLLYATYDIPGSLKVNYELPLSGMRVEIPAAEDYTNEFSIISVTRSFTLSASSEQERSEWVQTLRNAIDDHTSRQLSFLQVLAQDGSKQMDSFQLGTAAPVWIQDCRVTMCQLCTAEFTVTFRRHHCRACGKVVCRICSANKAPLQYMKFQTARVCDECYQSLLKDFDENEKNIREAIQHEICSPDFDNTAQAFKTVRASFKKLIPTAGRKVKRYIPQRLKEVCANDAGSQMSGWLHWRDHKSWKKNWFVLKQQVLYVYKASEDIVALKSIPILGCEADSLKDDLDEAACGFILTHKGKNYLEFQADNLNSSKRWISAMQEATVLK